MTDAQGAPATRPESALRRLAQPDREILLVWLASRASLFAVAGAAGWLLIDSGTGVLSWFDRWARWDFVHFQGIAEFGYGGEPTGVPNEAFLPGLPGLLWLGGLVGLPAVVTGLLVSLVAGAVAAMALGRLGDLEGGPGVGRQAVVAWAFAPPAVFLAAPYTESLFLALAIPSWLAARRGRWAYAGLFAAGACTVRVSGIFLVAALVVEWLTVQVRARRTVPAEPAEERGAVGSPAQESATDLVAGQVGVTDPVGESPPRQDGTGTWSVLWLLAPVVPLVAWMAYLRWLTGDWLAWLTAQAEEWNRTFTLPWDALGHTWDAAFGGAYNLEFSWMFRAEIVAVLIGLALTVTLLWWRRWGEATWIGLQVAAFATSYWFFSVPRATLLWWPLWIAIGVLAVRRRWVLWAYLAVSVPLMAVWAATFLTGRWAG